MKGYTREKSIVYSVTYKRTGPKICKSISKVVQYLQDNFKAYISPFTLYTHLEKSNVYNAHGLHVRKLQRCDCYIDPDELEISPVNLKVIKRGSCFYQVGMA